MPTLNKRDTSVLESINGEDKLNYLGLSQEEIAS